MSVSLLALLSSLVACGSGSGTDGAASPSSPASSGAATTTAAVDEFLRLTATHLCTVQGTVYDDPTDLAAAYDRAPDYPSLSKDQVAAFETRIVSDPDFSARLLEQVATACGSTR